MQMLCAKCVYTGRTGPPGICPVGPASRWAATSNVEEGQTTYPANRGRVGREWREGSEGQSHKEEGIEQGRAQGPLARRESCT